VKELVITNYKIWIKIYILLFDTYDYKKECQKLKILKIK
jgi:hypothetical protein